MSADKVASTSDVQKGGPKAAMYGHAPLICCSGLPTICMLQLGLATAFCLYKSKSALPTMAAWHAPADSCRHDARHGAQWWGAVREGRRRGRDTARG